MDFMDNLDFGYMDKKSNKVRSWYLYEQYKSLEENQLCASQKLKDRSLQGKILFQEILERRARRRLYDNFDHSENTSRIHTDLKSPASISTENFYESFSEFHEHDFSSDPADNPYDNNVIEPEETVLDDWSSKDSVVKNDKGVSDISYKPNHDNENNAETVPNSIIVNKEVYEHFDEHLKDELENAQKTIAQNLNLQLQNVKENIETLNDFNKLYGEDKLSDILSLDSYGKLKLQKKTKKCNKCGNNLYCVWSKLVSFAYQVIHLNHGNCYYDCSRQLLTAVLACDVIVRGVSKMCNMLQPYVSPVKFASDDVDDEPETSIVQSKIIKCTTTKNEKFPKIWEDATLQKLLSTSTIRENNNLTIRNGRIYQSELCGNSRKCLCHKMGETLRRASEPWACVLINKGITTESVSTIYSDSWSDILCIDEYCNTNKNHCKRINNPMLELFQYIDNELVLRDDSSKRL